jgi:hypothetical protein
VVTTAFSAIDCSQLGVVLVNTVEDLVLCREVRGRLDREKVGNSKRRHEKAPGKVVSSGEG